MSEMSEMRDLFIRYYYNDLIHENCFMDMYSTVEGTEYHLERDVMTHTNMVVSQYLCRRPLQWTVYDVCGAFVCAFHDTGKPSSEKLKSFTGEPDRNVYYGHELASARIWEDWATTNYSMLKSMFGFTYYDIYRVGWAIEYHLPFRIKKPVKVRKVRKTIDNLYQDSGVFYDVLLSDCCGRITSKDRLDAVRDWIEDVSNMDLDVDVESEKTVTIMIGASGSGKSTYSKEIMHSNGNIRYYSLDELRGTWYTSDRGSKSEKYRYAYRESVNDKTFHAKTNKCYIDLLKCGVDNIIIDNTNTTASSRNFYVNEARRHGFSVTACVFPISINELTVRALKRLDKEINTSIVMEQYNKLSYPSYGEFDNVIVVGRE